MGMRQLLPQVSVSSLTHSDLAYSQMQTALPPSASYMSLLQRHCLSLCALQ